MPQRNRQTSEDGPRATSVAIAARSSSSDVAADYIRTSIFEGRFTPGSRIPQDDVAAALEISRIPIREALITLERQGWVRIERYRGAFVSTLSETSVADHFHLFGVMYAFAVRLGIERSGAEFVGDLDAIIDRMRRSTTDEAPFGELARRYHATVLDAAKSPRISVALQTMSTLLPGDFFEHVPAAIPLEREMLVEITDAVRAADADRAADLYVEMMRRIGDLAVELFLRRGLFPAA